jgi:hypothetical protein
MQRKKKNTEAKRILRKQQKSGNGRFKGRKRNTVLPFSELPKCQINGENYNISNYYGLKNSTQNNLN